MDKIKVYMRRYEPCEVKNNIVGHYKTSIKANILDSDTYGPSSDKYNDLRRLFCKYNYGRFFGVFSERLIKIESCGTHSYSYYIGNPTLDGKIIPTRKISDVDLDSAIKALYVFSHYI